ncbi:MAG: SdiA-regulated domain-containing protein [Daejeonella sp.]|uniref:SdiA-regulated domain-containing protein n=1 Tax=Daejeonella sp. JGW-45 TaxID=3034148 RepID=UPI0023ED7666|nr:SdiA-regulated domain-containing protein [Daejeonella sp. JGW-45]
MRDKTPIKIIALIVIPIALAVAVKFSNFNDRDKKEKKGDKEDQIGLLGVDDDVKVRVLTSWLLPDELLEVSGISWFDRDRFACVQDELGKVFIFNTRLNKIEKGIPFGPTGDYEGVAVAGNAMYVLRADGVIFEISNFTAAKPKVRQYKTLLTKKEDSESLAFDKKNNRLLIAVKARDKRSDDYKGIYAFDLRSKTMSAQPVYKIMLNDPIFNEVNTGKSKDAISPSDIDIHPQTGDIYILEGTKPKLLVMNQKGAMLSLHKLKGGDFSQPEGLAFSPDGKMYISNEGNKGTGNILQVEIVEKGK